MNDTDAIRILEAVLLCAPEPVGNEALLHLFEGVFSPDRIGQLLAAVQLAWQDRGMELVCVAGGWRFQTRPDVSPFLERLYPERPPRYSRAVMETLAIIAYRQPVTRGDMEEIRGVTIGSSILRQIEERGWVEVVGHRDTVGRPALYATTRQFLDDLGLRALSDLPPLIDPGSGAAVLTDLEAQLSLPEFPAPDALRGQD